jgi:glycine cleavage system aminomethyltransferase T
MIEDKDKIYFKHSSYVPFDKHNCTYVVSEGHVLSPASTGVFHQYEFTGWEDECLSWHNNCYLHAGLNPTSTYRIKGPEALKLLSDVSVNSFKNFKIGRSKHAIMCDEKGKIVEHGTVLRLGDEEFITYWLWPYLGFALKEGNYDCEGERLTGKVFLYQLGGPKSLEIVEAATGEDFHDLGFLGFTPGRIDGRKITVFRIGMCGTLAYEIHGEIEDAIPVYNALLRAGEPFGIRRMGRNAYRVVHTEGGFPQINYHFPFARRAGFGEFAMQQDVYGFGQIVFSGSAADLDYQQHLRSPIELGWAHMVKFDHDFIGRAALEKEMASPKRAMVTLEYDHEDILDTYRSQFDKSEACTSMRWSEDFDFQKGSGNYHIDKVLNNDGEMIGLTSGRMFSPHYREMLSLCSLDVEFAKPGTDVIVLWGDVGTKQKKIRATVARFPYVNRDRNESVDTNTIPRLKK